MTAVFLFSLLMRLTDLSLEVLEHIAKRRIYSDFYLIICMF